jgi:hypothetical protein
MQVTSFFPFNGGVREEEKFGSPDKVQPACIESVNSIYIGQADHVRDKISPSGRGGDSSPPLSWEYSSPVFY